MFQFFSNIVKNIEVDVFFKKSSKNRIVKNWKTSHREKHRIVKKSEHCPPLYPPYPKFLQALRILLTPPESYYGLNSIKSNTNFTQNPYSSSLPAVCDVSPSSLPLSCLNSQLSLTSLHFPTTNPPSNCKPCQSR